MKTIGLFPGSFKPYHRGHDAVVRTVADENDEAYLFVSTSDRARPGELKVSGSDMEEIWKRFIEKTLPGNVRVFYGGVPVEKVYRELQAADKSTTDVLYRIYSDEEEIKKYSDASLKKYAPKLYANKLIELRAMSRAASSDISGTKMRQFVVDGKRAEFKKSLPDQVQKNSDEIFDILSKNIKEATLRDYIKSVIIESLG